MRTLLHCIATTVLVASIAAVAQPDVSGAKCPAAPEGWSVRQTRGPDFDVCYYRRAGKKGFLGIYMGFHPQFRPAPQAAAIRGNVGGIPVDWFNKRPESSNFIQAQEALLSPYSGDKDAARFKAHVWAYGETREEFKEVQAAAAKVRWFAHGNWRPRVPAGRSAPASAGASARKAVPIQK